VLRGPGYNSCPLTDFQHPLRVSRIIVTAIPPPTRLERLPAEQALLIAWPDLREAKLNLVALRAQCMCARCVDEITGQRIVDLDGIDPEIAISDMRLVGNYAVKFIWSDGHDTGLYTWPHLRQLCEEAAG
jgi:DUF971 family protein